MKFVLQRSYADQPTSSMERRRSLLLFPNGSATTTSGLSKFLTFASTPSFKMLQKTGHWSSREKRRLALMDLLAIPYTIKDSPSTTAMPPKQAFSPPAWFLSNTEQQPAKSFSPIQCLRLQLFVNQFALSTGKRPPKLPKKLMHGSMKKLLKWI